MVETKTNSFWFIPHELHTQYDHHSVSQLQNTDGHIRDPSRVHMLRKTGHFVVFLYSNPTVNSHTTSYLNYWVITSDQPLTTQCCWATWVPWHYEGTITDISMQMHVHWYKMVGASTESMIRKKVCYHSTGLRILLPSPPPEPLVHKNSNTAEILTPLFFWGGTEFNITSLTSIGRRLRFPFIINFCSIMKLENMKYTLQTRLRYKNKPPHGSTQNTLKEKIQSQYHIQDDTRKRT